MYNKLSSKFYVFEPITDNEIKNETRSKKKYDRAYDISVIFFKLSIMYVLSLLRKLFNMCVLSGIYSENFKLIRIIPMYKKGSQNEVSNHRPIGGLVNLS